MLLKSLVIIGALTGIILGSIGTSVPWLFPRAFSPDAEVIEEAKGKKRDLGVQGSEPVKLERMSRADDEDYIQLRLEQMLKSEI